LFNAGFLWLLLGCCGRQSQTSHMADDAHLQQLAQRLAAPAASGAEFVLSGKASPIQKSRHVLKNLGVPAARMATKAYWATGKCGLD